MLTPPKDSPWGEVEFYNTLCPGVFLVYTPDDGGTMVARDIEIFLSPAARKCGKRHYGYLCYEQDNEEAIVIRELLDKKLWDIPHWIKNKAAFEEHINNTLRESQPDYWRSREHGRMAAPLSKAAPQSKIALPSKAAPPARPAPARDVR